MPSCQQVCAGIPQRWIIILTCFLGLISICNVQICLSIAITQMVLSENRTIAFNKDTCPSETIQVRSYQNESSAKGKTFDWDEKTQGQILSSYYWGYIITCILSGSILDKLGGKRAMGLSVISTSLLTLLTPISVECYGATLLIVVRFFTGLCGGMTTPSVMKLMSRWIPEDERSWAAAWAFAGSNVGFMIGMGASGFIIQRSDSGWPAIFYTYGAFGIVIFCILCAICYESPKEHPWISKSEAKLLKDKLKHSHEDLPPTPWRHILRSKPIWAITIALIGNSWCHITMINDTPKYMSSVLKFNVETNGYVSSIPHVCSWILSCSLSWLSDRLILNKITSTACVRKINNSVAMLGGLFLVVATYVGCNRTLVVGLYVIAMTMFGCVNFGTMVNALDLAPNYAGAIQGILFGACICVGFMSPYVAGWLTPNQTIDEWRIVFWLLVAVGTATNLAFLTFGEAEVQEWNDPKFLQRENRAKTDQVHESLTLVSKKMQRIDTA